MKKIFFIMIIFLYSLMAVDISLAVTCSSYTFSSVPPCGSGAASGCSWSNNTCVDASSSGSGSSKTTGLGVAQTNLGKVTSDSGLSSSLEVTLGTVIKGALSLVGTVFLILTVYAGLLWMTARGEDSQVEKSQKIIKASIIGLFITMSAYAITFFITNRLSG